MLLSIKLPLAGVSIVSKPGHSGNPYPGDYVPMGSVFCIIPIRRVVMPVKREA